MYADWLRIICAVVAGDSITVCLAIGVESAYVPDMPGMHAEQKGVLAGESLKPICAA